MASTPYTAMGRPANLKTEQFDMESLFDFNQSTTQPSSSNASSSKLDATPKSASQDWMSPYEEERQQFNGPSHDYQQYRQQVGLPVGSMANMPPHSMYDGYNSGIGDMGFDSGYGGGWATGIDMDTDINMDFNSPHSAMPAMFFPPTANNDNNFVNPNSIGGQEPASNVGRLWPGMHSQQAQQAAMQKQVSQQRQMKMAAAQAQYRQTATTPQSQTSSSQQSNGHGKRVANASEPHVEESISRLLNQMRQNSTVSSNGEDEDESSMLPHVARMKKDEEEMDEDERLLASEEGKKLSSKERRQLRNKVSARAFRSRRKEYIGQLEGELAMKTQESANYRNENTALQQENERYRGLIETLLRHPAFTPFINDISKDPSVLLANMPQQQQQPQPKQQPSVTPTPQPVQPQQQHQQQSQQHDAKPEFMNFDASQLQVPPPQQQQQDRVGMAMIPENDFSKLNINGFNAMNFNNYSVNAFAVTSVPQGPDPVDLLIDSPASLPRYQSAYVATSNLDSAATCDSDLTLLLAKLDGAARNMKYSSRSA